MVHIIIIISITEMWKSVEVIHFLFTFFQEFLMNRKFEHNSFLNITFL